MGEVWKVKSVLKCLKPAFSLEGLWYVSLWENDPTSHPSYDLSKQSTNEFMVSIAGLKSSSTQHDVHYVNDGPIQRKNRLAFRHGCLLTDKWPAQHVRGSSVRSNQDILPSATLSPKYGQFCFKNNTRWPRCQTQGFIVHKPTDTYTDNDTLFYNRHTLNNGTLLPEFAVLQCIKK